MWQYTAIYYYPVNIEYHDIKDLCYSNWLPISDILKTHV